jgi:hypothetical protein
MVWLTQSSQPKKRRNLKTESCSFEALNTKERGFDSKGKDSLAFPVIVLAIAIVVRPPPRYAPYLPLYI